MRRSIPAPLAAGLALALTFAPAAPAADDPASADGVAALIERLDRERVAALQDYIRRNPAAADLDEAYLALFETAVANDWFAEVEDTARQYLAANPEGTVRPMAQIVATMARARAGQFSEAWGIYKELIRALEGPEQEEFASNFADSLAIEAAGGGAVDVARQVYATLLDKFGESAALRAKVRDDLARLDLVGKPAPTLSVTDIRGKPVRLADLRGKYVLVDFWATWCAPCLDELPNLQAAYEQYGPDRLEIVSISLDESPEAVADFVRAREIPWRQVHNATSGGDPVASFGINNLPATFLIDPEGKVVRLELRGAALRKTLAALLTR